MVICHSWSPGGNHILGLVSLYLYLPPSQNTEPRSNVCTQCLMLSAPSIWSESFCSLLQFCMTKSEEHRILHLPQNVEHLNLRHYLLCCGGICHLYLPNWNIYNTTQNNQMDPMANRYISSEYAMLSSNPQIRRWCYIFDIIPKMVIKPSSVVILELPD